MIKITNLNFQNQTIENIEVDCESINNVELKLTKTKFNIVIVKDGEVIKKEIKMKDVSEVPDLVMEDIKEEKIEVVMDEPVMEGIKEEPVMEDIKEEPVKEPVMEVEEEPVAEEPVAEVITLAKIKDLLKQHIAKKNTLDSYCRTVKQVHDHF